MLPNAVRFSDTGSDSMKENVCLPAAQSLLVLQYFLAICHSKRPKPLM